MFRAIVSRDHVCAADSSVNWSTVEFKLEQSMSIQEMVDIILSDKTFSLIKNPSSKSIDIWELQIDKKAVARLVNDSGSKEIIILSGSQSWNEENKIKYEFHFERKSEEMRAITNRRELEKEQLSIEKSINRHRKAHNK